MKNTNKSITTVAQEGPSLSMVGDTYRILIGSEQTSSAYALVDMLIPPKGGPPPHSHADFQEAFYILDGEIEVITKERKFTATKGSYVNIPFNGPIHKFTNKTDKTAHILCLITPAGMEKMFEEIGKPVAPGTFLSRPKMTPEEQKQVQSIAERYGQTLYPPDYLD
jgi:quercetin dioxygenase-like cupin family protein